MKRQLVRASIHAIDAIRDVNPAIRIFQIDPIINVVPKGNTAEDRGMPKRTGAASSKPGT